MKRYKVKVKVMFEGTLYVQSDSKKEAVKECAENFSMFGPTISTGLSDKIEDWEFPIHTDKVTYR